MNVKFSEVPVGGRFRWGRYDWTKMTKQRLQCDPSCVQAQRDGFDAPTYVVIAGQDDIEVEPIE